MPDTGVSTASMRIMRLLVGSQPQSVAELIRSAGVTRTAITEQLNELIAAGYVERTTERLAGRGRPRYLFAATKASLARLFTGNQWLLVPAMWEAIVDIGGKSLKRKVLKRVSRAMADHYRSRINGNTPGERLTEMAELLRDEGGLIDIEGDGNGQVVFHKRSCPFISMFEKTRTVCQVDLEVMTLVVGIRVRRTASRHDGAPCCSFAIKSSKGK